MSAVEPVDATPRYDLDVTLDPSAHELQVTGTLRRATPIPAFYLNPKLAITSLRAAGAEVPFERAGDKVYLKRPSAELAFQYRGQFPPPHGGDAKSHAWIEPTRIRLTEVTLWYPVLPFAGGDAFWPPEPAIARIRLPRVEGLTWVTSGQRTAEGTFRVDPPGDLVVVGVPAGAFRVSVPVGERRVAFDVFSPRSERLAAELAPIVKRFGERLGVREDATVSVVEFDSGKKNWLSFVSSGLIVFNATSVSSFLDAELRGYEIVAHELAHLWFGVALRPEGPSVRWLVESFAEYYAWRAVAQVHGEAAARTFVERAEQASASHPVRIDALGFGDELVYSRGALAVAALARAVGAERLDAVLRDLGRRRGGWSVAALFAALSAAGASESALGAYRARWGI